MINLKNQNRNEFNNMKKNKVVVTGIGIVSPVGLDRETTWNSIVKGQSGINTINSFDTEGLETTIAAQVNDFDPTNYISLKESKRMDRFVQFAVAASLEAVSQADLNINSSNEEDIAVVISSGIGGIITLSEQIQVMLNKGARRVSPFLVPMMLPDMASGQVSMLLGAKGPNFATVSACASGGDAIGQSVKMISDGTSKIAITGGTEAAICPIGIAGFNSCKALSKLNQDPQKASRPFDAQRDGFVLGEGAAILVLESLENAHLRGAKPLAEIIGYGATGDAHHITQPAPEGEGGARAMKIAIQDAKISAKDIDYINAHGTSTPMNDKYETAAMKTVFEEEAYKIPISSTKSMTGHLLGASGALEAALTLLSIINGTVPPTINLENPDPDCDLDYTPNLSKKGKIKSAMSNSFGFGGHNCSLIFKEFDNK
tara:strand:- start:64930 stop:66219 length:1290 start_codon:yes stop_codon:yes gene_type:complete